MTKIMDPKTTLTGGGIALAWILAFALKHYAQIEIPDEVTYGIVALGFALMGKFSKDSSKAEADNQAAAAIMEKASGADAVTKEAS